MKLNPSWRLIYKPLGHEIQPASSKKLWDFSGLKRQSCAELAEGLRKEQHLVRGLGKSHGPWALPFLFRFTQRVPLREMVKAELEGRKCGERGAGEGLGEGKRREWWGGRQKGERERSGEMTEVEDGRRDNGAAKGKGREKKSP